MKDVLKRADDREIEMELPEAEKIAQDEIIHILGEEESKLGIHSSSTRQVFFNETKVPIEDMLSERGNGFKIAMNSLNIGRIKLAAACIDAQKRVTTLAIKYASERIQFKKPIAGF